ncbi:hypothetical protein V8F33_003141 [Rhypophila sp. PSN 637]
MAHHLTIRICTLFLTLLLAHPNTTGPQRFGRCLPSIHLISTSQEENRETLTFHIHQPPETKSHGTKIGAIDQTIDDNA